MWLAYISCALALAYVTSSLSSHDVPAHDATLPSTQAALESNLRITAWNLRKLGKSKVAKPHVVEILIEMFLQYDLIFIQEITDAADIAIWELLDQLNEKTPDDRFELEISERLGRTIMKEQYGFLYRQSKLTVDDSWQYPVKRDHFERPPYVVIFKSRTQSETQRFGFIGIHIRPQFVKEELQSLSGLYDEVAAMWQMKDFILGGDFNAGCGFLANKDWKDIELRTQKRFLWLIDDDTDTTVPLSDCPYDRLVLVGSTLQNNYVEGSAGTYRFEQVYNMTVKEAMHVSDHVPVAMTLA